QAAGQVGQPFRQVGIRLAPERNGCFQPARTGLREPDGAAPQIAFDRRDLHQAAALQRAQIARQRRLIESRTLRQRSQSVVGDDRNFSQQTKLSDAKAGCGEFAVQELGNPPRRLAAVPTGAGFQQYTGIAAQRLWRGACFPHRYMYLHYFYLHEKIDPRPPMTNAGNILDRIGNTTLMPLRRIVPATTPRLLLNLETAT